jgi:amino acid adenylation domain-containing protein
MKNVLEYLEESVQAFPDKLAFAEPVRAVTYKHFASHARSIGTGLSVLERRNSPIAVLMEKGIDNLEAMLGVVYSGNFYVVIDSEMPLERMKSIFSSLCPVAIIADEKNIDKAQEISGGIPVMLHSELSCTTEDEMFLRSIRERMIDTDPLYCLFTSGSTGKPKGTIINHRNVMSYAEWVTETFGINENTVFGNQTPFYFSMSVLDIYSTIKNGATLGIIPREYFSFPLKLIQLMNEKNVNTIYWVPSAMCIVSNMKLFDYIKPVHLKKILFAGEVMPTKQLNYWISSLPDAFYANLFGPTEVTDICTYYVVNRSFRDDEPLPIGRPCSNCDVLVIRDDGTLAAPGEEGELCVRGSFLSSGYYNNPEKTREVFVQNPLNPYYPEMVYKTGDLVKYNELGELIYLSRKDFQIKHMGYRIELGEIETAASSLEGIEAVVCTYDKAIDSIVLVYQGENVDKLKIREQLKGSIPEYMMPNSIIQTAAMPYNANGKIDRPWIKNNYNNIKGDK